MGFWDWIGGGDGPAGRDWVDTKEREWRTLKECGQVCREGLFGKRLDLNTGDAEWVRVLYLGGYSDHPIQRTVRRGADGEVEEVWSQNGKAGAGYIPIR